LPFLNAVFTQECGIVAKPINVQVFLS
jgi:hypothetical protein